MISYIIIKMAAYYYKMVAYYYKLNYDNMSPFHVGQQFLVFIQGGSSLL
jgi:hypothetical protein